jgi:hypothetical protein
MQRVTFRLPEQAVKSLIPDLADWQTGHKKVHRQVFCILYQQVAKPVFQPDLPHDGQSGRLERQTGTGGTILT